MVKTPAGVGVVIPQGGSASVLADGTNIVYTNKGSPLLKLAMTDINTTLSVQQSSYSILEFTGTLTLGRNIVLPLTPSQYTVFNNTTGGFALTFIGATGTGIVVAAAKRAIIYADKVNIVRVTADL